jgi:hypothetical protein
LGHLHGGSSGVERTNVAVRKSNLNGHSMK